MYYVTPFQGSRIGKISYTLHFVQGYEWLGSFGACPPTDELAEAIR